MNSVKILLLIGLYLIVSACHTLTIINDKNNILPNELFNESAHAYHFYVGFIDKSDTIKNKCGHGVWEKIYIYREKVNASLETAADGSLLLLMFGNFNLGITVSLLVQATEGSPMIYKNTTINFTCRYL